MMNLRAGLVGIGAMGRHHARVLSELSGVELVGIADPAGDVHGVAKGREILRTVEELLELGLDYCVVAVPTAYHEKVALQLAEAGVSALIEKPLAGDVVTARKMHEAFESRGLVAAVGHIERYNPSLQQMRKRLMDGALGDVYQVVTRRQGPFPPRVSDVGTILDLATHDIDITTWVTGGAFTQVAAQVAYRSGREHEDLVAFTGKLDTGAVTNHLVNWVSPLKERVTVVTGERGVFVADTLTGDLLFHANSAPLEDWEPSPVFMGVSVGDVTHYSFPKPEPLKTEHEAFRDKLLGLDADIVDLRQGSNVVAVAIGVKESAELGATVYL
jgi:predicted dehydrogenase